MTDAAASNDGGFDAIAGGMLADEFRASEQDRKFNQMLDDHIDGVTYVEVDGVTYTDDGRLYEPMEDTPRPGAAEGYFAEERARAIYAGETPPATIDELHAKLVLPVVEPASAALAPELQRIVDLNARSYPTSATEIRAPGKHAAPAGPRHRAESPEQDRSQDVGR
ncbi:hypothetical protein E3O42_10145 [Cryobacterium adonitolivorans]|uniref:Uncharacterized protein n=1 Tax=Cryobacterium adonitolivorans TaxID=1259189 RepID=A0A4R8W871_9MICO|nr:hypothetical protein [Cryobacterium adonitolivorans]TFC01470.1 hypothetical protein E3O42_10145 [Cryobacterium adonitolivorans]